MVELFCIYKLKLLYLIWLYRSEQFLQKQEYNNFTISTAANILIH